MQTKKIKLSKLNPNPENPRIIRDDKFDKLVKSLTDFPEMADIRPIVVNKDMVILGGNMRYKAMLEAGWKEAPVIVSDLPEEKQREFMIKDNGDFGEWDFDDLKTDWQSDDLDEWGVEMPDFDTDIDYEPNTDPDTNYSDITTEQIKKEAQKLATQMIKNMPSIDCICPECGYEFEIEKK